MQLRATYPAKEACSGLVPVHLQPEHFLATTREQPIRELQLVIWQKVLKVDMYWVKEFNLIRAPLYPKTSRMISFERKR